MNTRYFVILVLYAAASFGAMLAIAEGMIWILQRPLLRGIARLRPSEGILAHVVLRFLPAVVATLLTLLSAVPGYLRGEPVATHERPGFGLIGLAIVGFCAVIVPVVLAGVRVMRTAAKVREWTRTATGRDEFSKLPMIELDLAKPLMVASGLFQGSIFLSRPVRSLLSPREMRAALRHEVAHCRKHHNLLKFVCALAPHLFATDGMDDGLSELLEFAADDDACSVPGDALNLASAVLILARERASQPRPMLYTALSDIPTPASLERRVQRLVRPSAAKVRSRLAQLATGWAVVVTMVAALGSLPMAQHAFRETLEMLVR